MARQHDTTPGPRLRLRPFPAMRFNADVVGDIGEVTSPPYDVMDRAMVEDLLNEHPRNIVRLIIPRLVSDPVHADNPYEQAAKLLARWRRKHVLRTDSEAGLYVYEYGDADRRVCGLVGALGLRKRDENVILPHEGVIPGIVADRLSAMSAARANLEPILLVYDGGGETTELLQRAMSTAPLTDVSASDGTFHRLWAITDSEELAAIRRLLAPHHALIADGHHRYATYLQLRRRHRAIGDGRGPWDRGLALLIDQSQFPLRMDAIHRSITDADLGTLAAPAGFELGPVESLSSAQVTPPQRPGEFVLTDCRRVRRVCVIERQRDGDGDGAGDGVNDPAGDIVSDAAGDVVSDAELLHERLLPAWGVAEDRIGYHHTIEQTLRHARQEGGLAVLLHPASVKEVIEVARAGKMMPRKSTSFGPKPRMGLIMRSFDDEL